MGLEIFTMANDQGELIFCILIYKTIEYWITLYVYIERVLLKSLLAIISYNYNNAICNCLYIQFNSPRAFE